MLEILEPNDFDQLVDLVYSIALKPEMTSYPSYVDGIKSKKDFVKYMRKSITSPEYEVLVYKRENEVLGLINLFFIEEEKYLQLCGFYLKEDIINGLMEMMEYISSHFPDYDLYFGFPGENIMAIDFFNNLGFSVIEDDYNDSFFFEDYKLKKVPNGVVRVNKDNFDEFRKIHIVDDETYWNADRLLSQLDKFRIYLYYEEEDLLGAIYERKNEIMGIDYKNGHFDEKTYLALVTQILNDLKKANVKNMVFFNEEESQSSALKLGCKLIGKYVLMFRGGNNDKL